MGRNRTSGTMIDRGPYRIPPMSALIAFESAARHGNFSHAARELHTSQSAISRYIASLEKHLSERLFDRSRVGVSLTDAGQRYYEAVLIGLKALRDGAAEVAALSGTGPPEVAIACPDEVSHLFAMQRFDALGAALGYEVRIRSHLHPCRFSGAPAARTLRRCAPDLGRRHCHAQGPRDDRRGGSRRLLLAGLRRH